MVTMSWGCDVEVVVVIWKKVEKESPLLLRVKSSSGRVSSVTSLAL
jgi:hypothetical protein